MRQAAEAHINLGTVTARRESLVHFEKGVRYLRVAETIPGYELDDDMQRYLDEYGYYVE